MTQQQQNKGCMIHLCIQWHVNTNTTNMPLHSIFDPVQQDSCDPTSNVAILS